LEIAAFVLGERRSGLLRFFAALSRIYAVSKVDVKCKGTKIAETRKGLATWRCVHHSVIQTLRFFAILCDFAFNLGVRFQLHRYGSE
jgi:hypothetical protein